MPGARSLSANQYYAHPQNTFWKILFAIFNEEFSNHYATKTQLLKNNNIALWDVLKSCERMGSLDSNIKKENAIVNDFNAFFSIYKNITDIYFNGQKAHQIFKQHIIKNSANVYTHYKISILPSTSPAHASMKYMEKLAIWKKHILN